MLVRSLALTVGAECETSTGSRSIPGSSSVVCPDSSAALTILGLTTTEAGCESIEYVEGSRIDWHVFSSHRQTHFHGVFLL